MKSLLNVDLEQFIEIREQHNKPTFIVESCVVSARADMDSSSNGEPLVWIAFEADNSDIAIILVKNEVDTDTDKVACFLGFGMNSSRREGVVGTEEKRPVMVRIHYTRSLSIT